MAEEAVLCIHVEPKFVVLTEDGAAASRRLVEKIFRLGSRGRHGAGS